MKNARLWIALTRPDNLVTALAITAAENIFPAPFPSLDDLQLSQSSSLNGAGEQPKKVVFFGTPFLLVRNLPPEVYATR